MTCMDPRDATRLRALPGNDRCIDCDRKSPEWASVKLGIFVCLECSGLHRSLGTHISFIRSVKMDSWTPRQIAMMENGGNEACKEFLSKHGVNMGSSVMGGMSSIKEKYDSPGAQLYQRVIQARVDGTEEPTELPDLQVRQASSAATSNKENAVGSPAVKIMEGFGSSPHPSELKGSRRTERRRRILAVGGAAVGAIAAVGMAVRNRRNAAPKTSRLSGNV